VGLLGIDWVYISTKLAEITGWLTQTVDIGGYDIPRWVLVAGGLFLLFLIVAASSGSRRMRR